MFSESFVAPSLTFSEIHDGQIRRSLAIFKRNRRCAVSYQGTHPRLPIRPASFIA